MRRKGRYEMPKRISVTGIGLIAYGMTRLWIQDYRRANIFSIKAFLCVLWLMGWTERQSPGYMIHFVESTWAGIIGAFH